MESTPIAISFDDIFGSNPENVSLSNLEAFLEQVVTDTFQKNTQNPNELVRVVDGGSIRWMTVEEADALLASTQREPDKQLQRNIQQALRGDSRVLDQEIKVLFLLANNTLKQYQSKNLISAAEIQRTEPILIRLGRQVNFQLNQLLEIDFRIQTLREKNPILNEFELKMGELLNRQKNGDHQGAALIAKELAALKMTYVRLSRGLKSDTDAAFHLRLDLQRHKKSILSSHRYLVAQREGVLREETQDLRQNIENLKILLQRSEEDRKIHYVLALEDSSGQLVTHETELTVIQKEQQLLKNKEEETDRVIQQIESASSISAKKNQEAPTAPAQEPPPETKDETKARNRMATVERRQQR